MKHLQTHVAEQSTSRSSEWLVKWKGHMSDGVGATNGLTPLAYLGVTGDELVLEGTRGTFRLPKAAIRRVGHGGFYPWLFRAVRIHHTVETYPGDLQFKPSDARSGDVIDRLQQLGFGGR